MMKLNSYTNNATLIKGLKNGDSNAYSFLVENFHHQLCVYALGLIGDHDSAEDIVQNVFVKIWRKRHQFSDDLDLKNYLYKSVYNGFIDQYRKMRTVFPLEKVHLEYLRDHIPDESDDAQSVFLRVKKEIEILPPKCKQIFVMSKQEGLTNIEIAAYLNISIKTVEGHITKAFTILRKTLLEGN